MRLLILIALTAIGLLLGLWLGDVYDNEAPQAWVRLPAPPAAVLELIPAGDPPLSIKVLDGSTYSLSNWNDPAWVEAAAPREIPETVEVQRPCDRSAPEFSPWSNPPGEITDCLQVTVNYVDGYLGYTFILDEDGYVWQTRLARNAYRSIIGQLCFPGSGLVLGALAWIPALLVLKKRQAGAQNRTRV